MEVVGFKVFCMRNVTESVSSPIKVLELRITSFTLNRQMHSSTVTFSCEIVSEVLRHFFPIRARRYHFCIANSQKAHDLDRKLVVSVNIKNASGRILLHWDSRNRSGVPASILMKLAKVRVFNIYLCIDTLLRTFVRKFRKFRIFEWRHLRKERR